MTTALVTGASEGIGKELAIECAADGNDVVLVARSEDKLRAIAAEIDASYRVRTHVLPADLTDRDAPGRIVERLQSQAITVDILINNAGFGTLGPFLSIDLPSTIRIIELNMIALTAFVRLLGPGMVERKRGFILNVASTAAFQPGPLMAAYYASKAYVLHLSEALANELKGTGVSVTALCPGPTRTGFQARAGMESVRMMKGPVMDAKSVARIGYRGMTRGKRIVIPGFLNKVVAQSYRVSPRWLTASVVRWIQEP
ncbi:MAG TPA: SDR family oxidoreductase [Gemmatimonadales bacterium]|nr:SDR family oxidoreductase [Gemmatimonadales bacterium]